MGDAVPFLTIGVIALAGFFYAGYKRTLEYELKKAQLRNPDSAFLELKRQVETLQAIVTASDYEARRRLLAHLPPTEHAASPPTRQSESHTPLTTL